MHGSSADLNHFAQAFSTEEELRNHLATLLRKMGNNNVQILHGTQEYGKDLIFYSTDGVGNPMLNACVVKNDKIAGAVDDNRSARTVFHQVEQALDTPFINSAGQDQPVSRVFVVSPFECSQPTMRSIQGKLKARSGQVDFLCGSRLERFANHWPEFLAFESQTLNAYVASLQKSFEQEDPIRFLGSQHNIFAGVNKSIRNVYVRQEFKLLIFQVELAVEYPHFELLHSRIGLDTLQQICEEIKFVENLSAILRCGHWVIPRRLTTWPPFLRPLSLS